MATGADTVNLHSEFLLPIQRSDSSEFGDDEHEETRSSIFSCCHDTNQHPNALHNHETVEQHSLTPCWPVKPFIGCFIVSYIALTVLIRIKEDWKPPLKMFRGSALLIALYMLVPVNRSVWEKAGLDYKRMFFGDSGRDTPTLSKAEFLKPATAFALFWSFLFAAFAFTASLDRAFYLPWSLTVWTLLFLYGVLVCRPFPIPNASSRRWLARIFFRIFTAPFWPVDFADFWVADQLCSLTQTMIDLEFSLCYAFVDYHKPGSESCSCPKPDIGCDIHNSWIRPLIACLPSYWRFAQCMRIFAVKKPGQVKRNFAQLINAGKYLSQFPVVIFSALAGLAGGDSTANTANIYYNLWIASSILHSLYVFVWDVVMDWGLCRPRGHGFSSGNCVLSRQLYFERRWRYYAAIVVDFFLRFSWSLKLSIQFGVLQSSSNDLIVAILAMLEVIRRFIWNFFRIENEQYNINTNCDC